MDKIKLYRSVILKNPLFSGMEEEELRKAVSLLHGRSQVYRRGEILHHAWTRMECFGLVLSGLVQARSDDFDGNSMIMAEVQPGVTFGESLCLLIVEDSPVYVCASEDSEVLWLSVDGLYGSREEDVTAMQKRFTALLAARILSMNNRIQILSKISIREKLMVYLSEMSAASGSSVFRIPFNREDMATYIGANRSALSRELAKMKREGIIDFHKNTFKLLKYSE
ncbi:MAG: Crp/Fnr family transcriptional regulator [Clostridiales bacterium]|nr:Crp/Fnr family transcriptional regulator [Clostridiales bacterium]